MTLSAEASLRRQSDIRPPGRRAEQFDLRSVALRVLTGAAVPPPPELLSDPLAGGATDWPRSMTDSFWGRAGEFPSALRREKSKRFLPTGSRPAIGRVSLR
jgi:hypothetical protein